MSQIKEIKIKTSIIQDMIDHAKELNPIECCGYLAGSEGITDTIYKMTNIDNSPEHFSFDPKEQFATLKDARNKQKVLTVVYHSHPETPARLSEEDLRLLNDPNMVYAIVSLAQADADVKAYQIEKKDDTEIVIHRVDIIKV